MIPPKLLQPYNPKETEPNIYAAWEESGFFNPDICVEKGITQKDAEPFSIVLPPPNVTGILHMGSALMLVIEDIFVRFARMRGKKTLWIPGTDSAAIATQAKVEKELQKKEKKNRHDLGREELLRRIDAFVEENKTTILDQIRKMGSSVDWSRYAYTMDEKRSRAVTEAFIRMYHAGLIERDYRVVNWDPKGQTVISDDEIEYEERETTLYTFRYFKNFPIPISTTRPETKVGDTAVAVHPDDERYKKFIGKEFKGVFAETELTIRVIGDAAVQKEFGTGALGVTPAHSHIDWDIALRNNLPHKQIIDERGKMTNAAGALVAGLKTGDAREKIVEWIRAQGLLEHEEKTAHNVSIAGRTGGLVEPLPKLQWFIRVSKEFEKNGTMTTLKEMMREAVAGGAVKILPDRLGKVYFHWIDNLRDWCISRQIWFGHRIPVWYHEPVCIPVPGREDEVSQCTEVLVEGSEPKCGHCNAKYTQDPDVLDTWFSSALWTFSTLGWPLDDARGKPVFNADGSVNKESDLGTYHPTTLLETGYDILFFWVARMILMSSFHLGEVPFETVYLHGIVRDERNRKISKSLGNNIDPLLMGEKYGTDAVRMSLLFGTAPGADSRISEQKIKAQKHFANKLWNIARFVLSALEGCESFKKPTLTPDDTALLQTLEKHTDEVTKDLENYNLHLAVEKLYSYVWHTFADTIIEESKPIIGGGDKAAKQSRQWTLYTILMTNLKLLHPFMPFVTEELWSLLPSRGEAQNDNNNDNDNDNDNNNNKENGLLMVEKWPT